MTHVFIIGSKGIPAKYGGFETFVDYLTKRKVSKDIKYHVSCMSNNNDEFFYNDARCFNVDTPNIGSAKAVLYDIYSLKESMNYIKRNNLENCVVYILACRIGPIFSYYKRQLEKMNVSVFVNPDGHEWKRSKWGFFTRVYWKLSERLMVKHADLLVCDSKGIETYIQNEYKKFKPKTTFIAYGADVEKSKLEDSNHLLLEWYQTHSVKKEEFYLVVGRFVPENNYETMIKEFMLSSTSKDLVIISNIEHNSFYNDLRERTSFESDPRIKFVGTIYNQDLLKKIREHAYGYIHGHEVGGTNPSLLEAMASTDLNILLDVVFNKEVGKDGALYFNKNDEDLSKVINSIDNINKKDVQDLSIKAKRRIIDNYSWNKIVTDYEKLFIENHRGVKTK